MSVAIRLAVVHAARSIAACGGRIVGRRSPSCSSQSCGRLAAVLLSAILLLPSALFGQFELAPPEPQREFRGVWVATVANIDWPSKPGLPVAQQRLELDRILDRAKAMRLNAVILQVRPMADAIYDSPLEPWSGFLTGAEGVPPEPKWDPLAHAVEGAHARGLELHAWFNPYRARHPAAKFAASSSSVARRFPEMVVPYGEYLWMDPGRRDAALWTLRVIRDVVRRYDIDGVHLDDYFYPYPARGQQFDDATSFGTYRMGGGKLERADWRRSNVDALIQQIYVLVKDEKPTVQVGISPFGIVRPGVPAGIEAGVDQYADLYADVRKWLAEGWLDYLAPQLYWPIAQREQSFATLLGYWAKDIDNPKRRHVWPGLSAVRQVEMAENWRAGELLEQVERTRRQAGASGHIHYSMNVFSRNASGIADALRRGPYQEVALPPATPWLVDGRVPTRPTLEIVRIAPDRVRVTFEASADSRSVLIQERRTGIWRSVELLGASVGSCELPSRGLEAIAVRAVGPGNLTGEVTIGRL